MHEASICQSLADLIADQAKADGFVRVRRVIVEVGALSHVEPAAMAFGWEAASRGGVAQGAPLEIARTPGAAWCLDCGVESAIEARGDPCPLCGGSKLMVTRGEELRLKELEVV